LTFFHTTGQLTLNPPPGPTPSGGTFQMTWILVPFVGCSFFHHQPPTPIVRYSCSGPHLTFPPLFFAQKTHFTYLWGPFDFYPRPTSPRSGFISVPSPFLPQSRKPTTKSPDFPWALVAPCPGPCRGVAVRVLGPFPPCFSPRQ